MDEGGDSGTNDLGDPGNPPDPPSEKTFSQADVDRIVQERLKKQKKELELLSKYKSLYEQQQKDLEELRSEIDSLKRSGDHNPSPTEGEREVRLNRALRELEEMKRALEEEKAARLAAERAKVLSERDSRLKAVLSDVGCVDIVAGERYLRDELVEEDGEWFLRTKSGHFAEITNEVVSELLPDFLKKPVIRGGSGAASGGARVKAKMKELESKKAQLDEARRIAASSGGNPDLIVKYKNLKREVESLEREIQEGK